MIIPTVGRVVLYRPSDYEGGERFAAMVAKVNDDETINIGYLDSRGIHQNEQNVVLVQDDAVPAVGQCEWMAYQKSQAGIKPMMELEHVSELKHGSLAIAEIDNDLPGDDDLDAEHEDNDVVTNDDLVETPDGTDESTDDNLSEDDITGDGTKAEERNPVVEEPADEVEETQVNAVAGNTVNVEAIAEACHEANRSYCKGIGDDSQVPWGDAPAWQKESAINGVESYLNDPRVEVTPEIMHVSWVDEKLAAGWVYGEVKDAEAKTHPCILPYEELPEEHRKKDELFIATIVGCLGEEAA